MIDYSAIILAGGKSSRMGRKKSELIFSGKTFLEILIDKLEALSISDILLSGYECSDKRVRSIYDIYRNKGPLGGVHACLREVKYEHALVLAEDAPFIPEDFLKRLIDCHSRGSQQITVSVCNGNLQPLTGIYDRILYESCEKLLREEKGNLIKLIQNNTHKTVSFTGDELLIRGSNTIEEYKRMSELFSQELCSAFPVLWCNSFLLLPSARK